MNEKTSLPNYEPPLSDFVTEMKIAMPQITTIFVLSLFSEWFWLLTPVPFLITGYRINKASLACRKYMQEYKVKYLDNMPVENLQRIIEEKAQSKKISVELFGTYLTKRRLTENAKG